MPAPNDYISPLLQAAQVNPAQSFAQGMQIGNGLIDNQRAAVKDQREGLMFAQAQQDRSAAMEMARAQAIAQAQKQVALAEDIEALKADGSTQAFLDFAKAHPEQTEAMVKLHEAQTKEVKDRRLGQSVRTKALISHGQKATAVDLLMRDALTLEESDPREAEALRRQAQSIDDDEVNALMQADLWLAAVAPKDLAEVNEKLSVQPGVVAKSKADAKLADEKAKQAEIDTVYAEREKLLAMGLVEAQADSLIAKIKHDAGTLGLGWAKHLADVAAAREALAAKSVEMTPGMQDKQDAASDAAVTSRAVSAKAGDLAARFEEHAKVGGITSKGAFARVGEAINDFGGDTGPMTEDRARLKGIIEKIVGAELKGGGAITDGEREAIRRTMPKDNSDPARIAAWLRRVERLEAREAKIKQAKAEFIGQNGSLKPTTSPIDIGGFVIPAGTTYPSFAEAFDAHLGPVDGKPAAKAPDPAAAAANDALFGVSGG
jgi:hypothetical protein